MTSRTNPLFLHIAKKHLAIETLVEQHSDRLDFHEVSVLGITRALEAAYLAGQQASKNTPAVKTPPEPQTAAGQYAVSSNRIDALLARLNAARLAHAAKASANNRNLGFAGELAALEALLERAVVRMEG